MRVLKIETALQGCLEEEKRKFVPKVELQIKLNKKIVTKAKPKKSLGFVDFPNPFPLSKEKIACLPHVNGFFDFSALISAGNVKKIKRSIRGLKWLVCTREGMQQLRGLEPILATYGIMPDEKDGSIAQNLSYNLEKIASGRQKIRANSEGNCCFKIGTIEQSAFQLKQNIKAAFEAIINIFDTPKELMFVKAYVHTTMGKTQRIDFKDVL